MDLTTRGVKLGYAIQGIVKARLLMGFRMKDSLGSMTSQTFEKTMMHGTESKLKQAMKTLKTRLREKCQYGL
jgi:hypothetical protein